MMQSIGKSRLCLARSNSLTSSQVTCPLPSWTHPFVAGCLGFLAASANDTAFRAIGGVCAGMSGMIKGLYFVLLLNDSIDAGFFSADFMPSALNQSGTLPSFPDPFALEPVALRLSWLLDSFNPPLKVPFLPLVAPSGPNGPFISSLAQAFPLLLLPFVLSLISTSFEIASETTLVGGVMGVV